MGNEAPMVCVRRAVWGMLYADDAGIVSRSAEGLAKMMTVIVTVFEAAGLTVSEKTLLRTPGQTSLAPSLVIEAAGQRYRLDRPTSSLSLAASSTKALISRSISNERSVSCGDTSNGSAWNCMIGRPLHLVCKSVC